MLLYTSYNLIIFLHINYFATFFSAAKCEDRRRFELAAVLMGRAQIGPAALDPRRTTTICYFWKAHSEE